MKGRKSAHCLKKYVFISGIAVAVLAAYGIWQSGLKGLGTQRIPEGIGVQDTAGDLEVQQKPEGAKVQGREGDAEILEEAIGSDKQNTEDNAAVKHVPEGAGAQDVLESAGAQEVPGSLGKTENADIQKMPSVTEVQHMAAGTVVDVSNLSQEMLDSLFYSSEITEEVQQRIQGISYHENENISLIELRYLRVLHRGFDGQDHIGELIVNQVIAEDILEIMAELYRQSYPIEKMLLIDEYGADDEQSMEDNNTSAFNYREIAGSGRLSNHAEGLAIDINPLYNPYVKQTGDGGRTVSPSSGEAYADREGDFPYKIDGNDLCCQLFLEHGFAWGGNWNSVKDYQHFEYGAR